MAFTIKDFDELVADMVTYIIANSPQINDLTPGSVIRSFCEAASLCLDELYVSTYLGFQRYLNDLKADIFDFERKTGTIASTNVIFSRAGSTGQVTMPTGSRLKTPSDLVFETQANAIIEDGNTDSNAVEVHSEAIGAQYNVGSGSITVIVDNVSGIETVTNAASASGGTNMESDYDYKKRFQTYIEGLGRSNLAGIASAVLSIDGIVSSSIVEHFPPVLDVNATVYVDDGTAGGIGAGLVSEAQAMIDGNGTEEYPGYRAAGVNVEVVAATVQAQPITATISLQTNVDEDQAELDVESAVTSYINGLGVDADIIYNEIVASIMGVYGVTNCNLTVPVNDVVVASTQVGRASTFTITVV